MKGCRRTQQTNGRRRLTTELANDAENSLNLLVGFKDSSLTPLMHVESLDKKHSAFRRHLCGEALRRQLPVNDRGPMRRSQRCSRECQITLSRRLQGTWLRFTPVRIKRLPTHLRRGVVNRSLVSGGGTTANEAGPRRHRCGRVASCLP